MFVTLFQMPPSCVVAEPNQIAVFIGHLSWDADFGRSRSSGFVAGFSRLQWFSCVPVSRFVGIRVGVEIGISAVPNKADLLFETKVV